MFGRCLKGHGGNAGCALRCIQSGCQQGAFHRREIPSAAWEAVIWGTWIRVHSILWLSKVSPQGHRIRELGICEARWCGFGRRVCGQKYPVLDRKLQHVFGLLPDNLALVGDAQLNLDIGLLMVDLRGGFCGKFVRRNYNGMGARRRIWPQ
jgi:hypothetical protein